MELTSILLEALSLSKTIIDLIEQKPELFSNAEIKEAIELIDKKEKLDKIIEQRIIEKSWQTNDDK